ncbi:MAG: ATP-dependent Clp protease adaptor ClpS [Myxococcales bacterium]|nr:ATP-dependent Clp protease adaptor ClpS [Myxococcales bacterium]
MSTERPRANQDPDREGDLAVQEKQKTRRARPYNVVFHNDDYTTMEFVIHVLMQFFHKSETESTQIMLEIHHRGFGVVGAFTRDVAETKAEQVMSYAKKHGHPLRATAEPADDAEDEA